MRRRNSTTKGTSFSETTISRIWQKAVYISGFGTNEIRRDYCGAKMRRGDYGKTTSHGWELDHIKPVSKGGGDEDSNLQALQWENNRHKGDDYPNWNCLIKY